MRNYRSICTLVVEVHPLCYVLIDGNGTIMFHDKTLSFYFSV